MPYSITYATKILTLTIAPFLSASSVNFLWCQVCTFHCPLWKKRFTFLPEGTDVHIQQHINQKDLNLCYIMLLCQGCCWIGKNINNKFSCVMVLIVRPSSTLKFQFIFGFNEYLWEIVSLLNFVNFWFIFGLWMHIYDFWLCDTNDFKLPLTPCQWIKNLSAKTTNIYYEMLKKICKRKV